MRDKKRDLREVHKAAASNLLAMEAEELIRSHPIDGAVLMGGCDKTTPGLVMGAISSGLPFIYLPAGPMLRGNFLMPEQGEND